MAPIKPQIWELGKQKYFLSGRNSLDSKGLVCLLRVKVQCVGEVSAHVIFAMTRVLDENTPRTYFIGFEPNKYSL